MHQESPQTDASPQNEQQAPAFRFSIRSLIVVTAAMSLFFGCSRMFASIVGVSVSSFIIGMGVSFFPVGFVLVITGAAVLAIYPEARWAKRSVNVGGIMMGALLPAVFIGSVLSAIVAYFLQ